MTSCAAASTRNTSRAPSPSISTISPGRSSQNIVERIAPLGEVDLMAEYFEPLSSLALARSLGFDSVDVKTLQRWFHGMAIGAANYENDPEKQAISDAANAEVEAAIIPIFERLERNPGRFGDVAHAA